MCVAHGAQGALFVAVYRTSKPPFAQLYRRNASPAAHGLLETPGPGELPQRIHVGLTDDGVRLSGPGRPRHRSEQRLFGRIHRPQRTPLPPSEQDERMVYTLRKDSSKTYRSRAMRPEEHDGPRRLRRASEGGGVKDALQGGTRRLVRSTTGSRSPRSASAIPEYSPSRWKAAACSQVPTMRYTCPSTARSDRCRKRDRGRNAQPPLRSRQGPR